MFNAVVRSLWTPSYFGGADRARRFPASGRVFRLAEGSIVTKAIVRFEGDQTDTGVDHGYLVSPTVGKGAATDVSVTVDAAIPATIIR